MILKTNQFFPSLKNAGFYLQFSYITKGILICAIVFSVFLILLEHNIKYIFFILGILLASIIILFLSQNDFRFKIRIPTPKLIDYFFIICSVLVFTIDVLLEPTGEILFPFSIIVSFFLPGWVLLRILGVNVFQRLDRGVEALLLHSIQDSITLF